MEILKGAICAILFESQSQPIKTDALGWQPTRQTFPSVFDESGMRRKNQLLLQSTPKLCLSEINVFLNKQL